ncbi:hypothetical protein DK033_24365 [Salmonella enterica subsp. enterica]|nr:hypothetical protein [Salmonella enterica subsp. enterica serovar Schwarzengrund]
MVCVVGRMRDLILQLSKSSIYSTKPLWSVVASYPPNCQSMHLSSLVCYMNTRHFYLLAE